MSKGKMKGELEVGSDEGWGWNDGTGAATDDLNWDDDPWADMPTVEESVIENPVASKTALRLGKLVNKADKPVNGLPESVSSVPTASHPPSSDCQTVNGLQHHADNTWQRSVVPAPAKRPLEFKTDILTKECFTVPNKAKFITLLLV